MTNKSEKYWIYGGIATLLILLAFALIYNFTKRNDMENTSLTAYLEDQDTIMSAMMEKMTVESSGNASLDFLTGMIPHHESAIDMSKSYLKYGGANDKLKTLAEDIIAAQTKEIEEMKRLIKELKASGETDETKADDYLKSYNKMLALHEHMGHGTSSYSDVEHAFAEGMIMHHQMAVDMAEAILGYTDYAEVRTLAQNIIELQEKEIVQMQGILEQ